VEIAMRHIPELLDDTDQLAAEPAMHDTSLFTDIPRAIWTAFLSAWAMLFALFIVFFSKDGQATISVVTASFFALMILGLPAALAAQSSGTSQKWPRVIMTRSGPLPVRAAATQILLIPVCAVFGLILFILLAM
jgi:hypothetical protein